MSARYYTLDEQGAPRAEPSFTAWMEWMELHRKRYQMRTWAEGALVETNYAGLRGLLWETSIEGGAADGWYRISSTLAAANLAHDTATVVALAAAEGGSRAALAEARAVLRANAALREALESSGIRKSELATRLGVSRVRITHLFSGLNDNPTIRTLARLAYALGRELYIELRELRGTKRKR